MLKVFKILMEIQKRRWDFNQRAMIKRISKQMFKEHLREKKQNK